VLGKLKSLVLVALAAGFAWVAAPALSTTRYMPRAVDFEQRLPSVARLEVGKGPAQYRSPVLVAPERFDLVGLAGELRALELRARDAGGEWTDWIQTEDGNPIYFGGADEVQLRTRGWRPSGRLHYVNVSGTTSEAGGLLTGARKAINSGFISITGLLSPASAEAVPARPTIISRTAWGADDPKGGCPPRTRASFGTVKAATVHHTVSANDYSEAEAAGIVLGICRFHRNGNGWNDIGYNALVDDYGNLYAGRAGGVRKAVVGAQAQGFNAQTTGVATIGTHTQTPITPATRQALVDYLAWKLSVHRLSARGKTTMVSAGGEASRYPAGRRVRTNKIIGHGTVGLTACPGEALEAEMPKLRRLVQQRIDQGGGPAEPPPPPPDDGGGVIPPPVPK
jgi:N-acetylmuramoyl-L-alanine amidase